MNKHQKWLIIIILLLIVAVLSFGLHFLKRPGGALKVYVGVAQARLFQEGSTEEQMFENADNVPSWNIPFGSTVEVRELKGDMVKVSLGPIVKSGPSEANEVPVDHPNIGWMYRYDLCFGPDLERRRIDGQTLKSPIRVSIKTDTETGEYDIICAVPLLLGEPDSAYRPVWLDETCIGYTCDLQKNNDTHSLTHKENVMYYLDDSGVIELSILPSDFMAGNTAKQSTSTDM